MTVNVETCELVVDVARCIESTEDSTNHAEVFVSPEYYSICSCVHNTVMILCPLDWETGDTCPTIAV